MTSIFGFDLLYIFAADAAPVYLTEIVVMIVAGAAIAYLSFRLRLVPIVGFLLAGVLIGPHALGLVPDREMVNATAEIGVILLLFTIGIEFSLEKLLRIRHLIFGGGGLQVGLSTIVVTGLLTLFGIDWHAGLFTGFLVALSSTAIVLKILGDTGETNSETGQVEIGLLIFQDLAVVVMVLLVPMLAGGTEATGALDILWALTKAVLIIAAVLLVARRIMPQVLEAVARTCSPELFLLTVIAICFGTAYLTNLAGVSLSLGAFLAGILVSESRFSQHALGETLPLQILFSATFFVSVGMLLDVSFLVHNLPYVLAAIAAILVIKIATTAASVLALGYKMSVAVGSALMLAQIGEFSFVLERAGREVGLTPAGMNEAGSQEFIAATVVLMIATPFLMSFGRGLSTRLENRSERVDPIAPVAAEISPHSFELEDHVIVAGYGQAARSLVKVLNASGIPFVIATLSPTGANEAEEENLPVLRGDYSKQFVLQTLAVNKAKMLVVADDNPSMAHRVVMVARQMNTTMRIVVRTRYTAEIEELTAAGADIVIAEELESIVQLFGEVLRDYRIAAEEIEIYENLARQNGYAAFVKPAGEIDRTVFACETGEDCLNSRTVIVREASPIAKKRLADLQLGEIHGLHLKNIRRDGKILEKPPADFILKPGDELVLSGSTEAFAHSAALFRPFTPEGAAQSPNGKKTFAADGTQVLSNENKNMKNMIDTESEVIFKPQVNESVCSHLEQIRPVYPSAPGCEECLRTGDKWVHLRICLVCGHVGCCDSSKNKHSTAHYAETGHPVVKSMESGENWAWCYKDKTYL